MLNTLAATFIPKLNETKQKNVWRNVTFFVVWIILTKVDVMLTTAQFMQNKENPCHVTKYNKAPKETFVSNDHHVVALLCIRVLLIIAAFSFFSSFFLQSPLDMIADWLIVL